MKKLISLLLAVTMLLAVPVSAGAWASNYTGLVTDGYSGQFNLTGYGEEYHIPQVNLEGAGVTALNAIIWYDLYDGYMIEIEYAADDAYSDYWPSVWNMNYQWALNGDVLSIWVCLTGNTDEYEYYVYNMSLSTGEQMSNAELLKAAGVTREQFNNLLRSVLSARLDETHAYLDKDYMQMMGKDALSARNIGMAMPYIGSDGSLCAVAWVYTPAGAGRYLDTLTLIPGDV